MRNEQKQEAIWLHEYTDLDIADIANKMQKSFWEILDLLRPYFEEAYIKRKMRQVR